MANYFDQFDTEPKNPINTQVKQGNYFDQFDDEPKKPEGFVAGIRSDYNNRLQNNKDIAENYVAGKLSYPDAILQFGGQGAALGSDILLQGLKSIGNSINNVTPDYIKEPIKQRISSGLDYISNSPVGDAASKGANYALQKYEDIKQKYPRTVGDAEALLNIGLSIAPTIRVGGKSAASTTESLAKEGLKKVASPLVPSIPEGAAEVVQLAKKYNIPVSLPQVSDSRALANVQKVSQELPFSGSQGFRDKQLLAWQKQLLKTTGMNADRFSPSIMDDAFKKVGNEFDNLTKGKTFNIADNLVDDLTKTKDEILSAYGSDAANAFEREGLKVLNDFTADNVISGEKLSFQRARINALARKATGANKEALRDLENVIIDGITSGDPESIAALSAAKGKYKNLIAIEPLAQKAKKGFINPTLLNNRISKIYGRAYTTGNAGEIGDLARIGHELLGELGGSDTTQKMLYTIGATGGAIANLPITAGMVGANRALQSGLLRNQGLIKLSAEKAQKQKLKQIMKMKPSDAKKALEELEQ